MSTNGHRSLHDLAELKTMYDEAPLGLCLLDRELRYVRINERLAAMNGVPVDHHIGRTLREIVPHVAEHQEPVYRRIIETGEPVTDLAVTTKSPDAPEESRHFLVSYFPILVEDRVECIHTVVADVTAQARAREAQQRGERRLRRVLETAPDALLLVNRNGTVTFANERVKDVFGHEPPEVVGEAVARLIADIDGTMPAAFTALFRGTSELDPSDRRIQIQGLRTGGTTFDGEVRLSVLDTEGGRLVSASIRDVSERNRTQRALAAALEEVEKLKNRLQEENAYLWSEVRSRHLSNEIVGECPVFAEVLHGVEQVAPTDATVLLLGETGSGKEVVARAIHRSSRRSDKPLIVVNCAALPPSLVESELFGHEKGAFTGAFQSKLGRFELADGGTIFLDEIGELSVEIQAKLLRVLQEGEFERVGGTTTRSVDVRVLAATNRDLERGLDEGWFRPDLYYRLTVFPINIPPLRARVADIPLLAWHFVGKHQNRMGKAIDQIPQETMTALMDYDWPGNVRELENVIERALILSRGRELEVERPIGRRNQRSVLRNREIASLREVERDHILRVLESSGWVIKGTGHAAERLGLHPSTLLHRMKKLGIERPRA